jgi:hypothetical protein
MLPAAGSKAIVGRAGDSGARIPNEYLKQYPKGKPPLAFYAQLKLRGVKCLQRLHLQWVVRNQYARNKAIRRSTSGGKIEQAAVAAASGSRSRKWGDSDAGHMQTGWLGDLAGSSCSDCLCADSCPRACSDRHPAPQVSPQGPEAARASAAAEWSAESVANGPDSANAGESQLSRWVADLGEILRDVRKLTGASIDVPPGSAVTSERVIAHLGPGAPRDVLAGLFNGTQFNYVMLGSSSDPMAVSSVVLTLKTSAAGETQTAANVYQNNPGPMPPNRFPQPQPFNQQLIVPQPGNGQPGVGQSANAEGDESKDEEQDNADDSADDQAQAGQPGQPEVNGNVQDQQQQDPNQPNAGPKTPEQILEMLRRQQPPGAVIPPPPPQQ